jgi:hypothetical protein
MNRHLSDCATHNEPAERKGICNCLEERFKELVDKHLELSIKYSDLADKYCELKTRA